MPQRDENDIDFADIDPGLHLFEVRHRHDLGARHERGANYPLASLAAQPAHRPGNRRIDSGFAQIILRLGQSRLGLGRLMHRGLKSGLHHFQRSFRLQEL